MEQAKQLMKQHKQFMITLEADGEQINGVNQLAKRLIDMNAACFMIGQKSKIIEKR